jgi:hypothetical protein
MNHDFRLNRRRAKRLLRSYPELFKMFRMKQSHRRRAQVHLGTDGRPYITFDNDWTIGRNYMSVASDGGLQIGS